MLLLAMILVLASSTPDECYGDGQRAFVDGRMADAARLYLENADRPECAAEAATLRINSILARARLVGPEPSRAHCGLVDALTHAIESGLTGAPRSEAEARRIRHERVCRLAEAMYGAPAGLPVVIEAPTPSVEALLPAKDVAAPTPYALVEDTTFRPYAVSAAVLASLSAAGGGAMLALKLDAEQRRDEAAAAIGLTWLRSAEETRAIARYTSADDDAVLYGRWFQGLSALTCLFVTTGITLWLLEDEPTPMALVVDEGGDL